MSIAFFYLYDWHILYSSFVKFPSFVLYPPKSLVFWVVLRKLKEFIEPYTLIDIYVMSALCQCLHFLDTSIYPFLHNLISHRFCEEIDIPFTSIIKSEYFSNTYLSFFSTIIISMPFSSNSFKSSSEASQSVIIIFNLSAGQILTIESKPIFSFENKPIVCF